MKGIIAGVRYLLVGYHAPSMPLRSYCAALLTMSQERTHCLTRNRQRFRDTMACAGQKVAALGALLACQIGKALTRAPEAREPL